MAIYFKQSGEKLSPSQAAKMTALNENNPDRAWNQDRSSARDILNLASVSKGVRMPRNRDELIGLEKRASSFAQSQAGSGVNIPQQSDLERQIAATDRVGAAAANLRNTQNKLREDGRLKSERERITKASDYMESFTQSPGYDKGQVVLKDGMINKLASFANLDLPIQETQGENGERSFSNAVDGQVVATRETSENGRNWWKYSLKKTDENGNVTLEPIKQANGQPMMFDENVGKELANRKRFISEIEGKAADKKDANAAAAAKANADAVKTLKTTYVDAAGNDRETERLVDSRTGKTITPDDGPGDGMSYDPAPLYAAAEGTGITREQIDASLKKGRDPEKMFELIKSKRGGGAPGDANSSPASGRATRPQTFEDRVTSSQQDLEAKQADSQRRQQEHQIRKEEEQAQQQAMEQFTVLGGRFNGAIRDPALAARLYQELSDIAPRLPPDAQEQAIAMAAQLKRSF